MDKLLPLVILIGSKVLSFVFSLWKAEALLQENFLNFWHTNTRRQNENEEQISIHEHYFTTGHTGNSRPWYTHQRL